MKIFITGGTGFIGSHLVRELTARNHHVCILSRKSPQSAPPAPALLFKGDLGNPSVWEENVIFFKPEAVIHLAWEGIPDPSETLAQKNKSHALNLIRLTKDLGAETFLGLGSCLEYGGLEGPVAEEEKGTPPNPLYRVKAEVFEEGKEIALRQGVRFIWARPFYVYGPGQRADSLIPSLINAFRRNETPRLKSPDAAHDFIFVEDVAEAIADIIEKTEESSAVYNIGSGYPTSVARAANLIARALNRGAAFRGPERSAGFFADVSRIKREIGWCPQTSIETGVKKTVEYKQ